MTRNTQFNRKSPCNNCPYRIDAPLAKWDKQHFKDLLASEQDYLGVIYGCHKNDGHVCVGWLMDQDNRRFPSIALRIVLSKHNVTREYLDKLRCKSPLFESVEAMCYANFPELKDQ